MGTVSANRRYRHQTDEAGAPVREVRRVELRRERRSQLLEAAIREIRSTGPGATMEQLAKGGGVTKPILYRHFGDRDGLIAAIAEQFSAQLLASVEGPLLSSTQPRELLVSTIDGYVRFLEGDPAVYGFLVQQTPIRGDEHNPIGSLVDVLAKQIAQIAGEQLRMAGRDTGGAVPWAYGIVGMVHTATNWWLQDQTMTRDRFVGYLTTLLWDGLAGAGQPTRAGAET